MPAYEWDLKKIGALVAVVLVVAFVYNKYIKESFVAGADIKMAYTPPPASHITSGIPTFTDGPASPEAADDEPNIPYSPLDSSYTSSPLDAVAKAPCSSCTSAATSKVEAIASGSVDAVEPAVVGDGDLYSSWVQ